MNLKIESKRVIEKKDKITYSVEFVVMGLTESEGSIVVSKEEYDKYIVGQVLEL